MSDDAYIRLTRHGIRSFGTPRGLRSLLFVDVEPDIQLGDLRRADFSIFREVGVVLVRGARNPAGTTFERLGISRFARTARKLRASFHKDRESKNLMLEELTDVLVRQSPLSSRIPEIGVIEQQLGEPPEIESETSIGEEYLDRARAIELEALLRWGNGIWTPKDYHYRLPSGEHAEGFVRLADAFRIPRDAEVLATWLYPSLRPGIGLVLDTGTLAPLALAASAAMRTHGWEPGPVEVLDGYPATSHQVHASVDQAKRWRSVLAILSVNSSGRIRDLLYEALHDLQSDVEGSIEVLLSKRRIERTTEVENGVRTSYWHPLPETDPLVPYGAEGSEVCNICADPERSRIVPISPTSFDGTFEAAIHRLMPSVDDANASRALWERCDEIRAIDLEGKAEPAVEGWRSEGKMPVKIGLAPLAGSDAFRSDAVEALSKRLEKLKAPSIEADLVLGAAHEASHPAFEAMIEDFEPILGKPTVSSFPVAEEWSDELNEQVREAESIAIVALGSVTGISLLSALVATQKVRRPGDPINGIIVHARPQQRRAWQTLENAFGGRLYPAFHSYFPGRSPLEEELQLLTSKGRARRATKPMVRLAS